VTDWRKCCITVLVKGRQTEWVDWKWWDFENTENDE